ncbi:unnamed protein product [Polarella glacialis]|uniref:TLC domain-containing protein n=1 Tax=Polarella glacialis TaxID=89957 RepID=A0A813IMP8_POLGL|nr:unnamed protein product [Polarella glacialis]
MAVAFQIDVAGTSPPALQSHWWTEFDQLGLATVTSGALAEVSGPSIEGISTLVLSFACWTAFWTGLFYALSATADRWMRGVPASTKAHENDKYWCARNLIGGIHATFVAMLTVPACIALLTAPSSSRFAHSRYLGSCPADPGMELDDVEGWSVVFQGVALAGLAFTSFTFADLGISLVHGLATADFIVHHIVFVSAGMIIRGWCVLPFNAAMLLAMEVSTPSLNYLVFFRHRGEAYESAVKKHGIVFVVLYIIFRLGVNSYGAVLLWIHRKDAVPGVIPEWQVWFLLSAVSAGVAVQIFWFPAIVRTFGSEMCGFTEDRPDPDRDELTQQSLGQRSCARQGEPSMGRDEELDLMEAKSPNTSVESEPAV